MFAGRKKKHKDWFAAMPLLSPYLLISLVTTSTLLLCSHVGLLLPCNCSLIFYLPLFFVRSFLFHYLLPLSSHSSLLETSKLFYSRQIRCCSPSFVSYRLLIYFPFCRVCVHVRRHVVCRWHCTRTCSLMPVPLLLLCITNLFFSCLEWVYPNLSRL